MTIPVTPDTPEALRWLRAELALPEYEAAKPTWFDRLSKSIADWLGSLRLPAGDEVSQWGAVALVVIVIIALAVAFWFFGMPRLRRRSTVTESLFGTTETRTAAMLRTDGHLAAEADDYRLAIQEIFRALARGLEERTLVEMTPGTTAHGFARQASAAFPGFAGDLEKAARGFEDVRYLGAAASRADYDEIAGLEQALRTRSPQLDRTQAQVS